MDETQQNEQEELHDDGIDNMEEILENLNEQQMDDELSRGFNDEIALAESFTSNSLFSMNSFDQTLEIQKMVRNLLKLL